jgi:beta-lactam-binding protein with PASTA domain
LPAGTAAGSDPGAGTTIGKGSTVTVNSSNGSMTLLPNVVGQDEAAAKGALAGFSVEKREQAVTDKSQDGKVIATEPAAGTPVKSGSKVTLVIGALAKADKPAPPGNGNGG